MNEIREVLRAWLAGAGLRRVAAQAGVDRKTARRYVEAAVEAGLARDGGAAQLTDELVGQVAQVVRPVRPGGHGPGWEQLEACHAEIEAWVKQGLTAVKIGVLLGRRGIVVPYRTLHRFCVERCGFGRTAATVRVADGEPGAECQLDFGYLGLLADPVSGRQRRVQALIFTACYSRHMFVWLSFTQTLAAFIAGCEAAWVFFGGVFKVLIPDNASAIVAGADAVSPRFTAGWLDYAQHCGFATDAARVRSPKDKPKVERAVQYVRGNFFAGEHFTGLADAQAQAEAWCRDVAGMRIHGTIAARPAEVFAEYEAGALLPLSLPYDVPVFAQVKVHRDFHVEVGRALYSAPKEYLGCHLDARADSALVKLFHHGVLVKTHPRQQPGRRSTDPADLPAEKTTYAMRDVTALAKAARRHGDAIGVYAERLLDTDLPWTKMRQVYRLPGLVRRYGPGPADQACARALEVDVVNVTKIASMLERATENTPPPPRPPVAATARFARPRRIPGHPADPHPRREGGQPMTTTMRDPVSPDLRKTLRALKPGQMLATLPDRLTLARQQKMAHADFLELVLADEVTRREAKSASLRARAAGLDPGMRLDTWDQTAAVRYDQQLWNELTSLRFLDGPHGAIILGPVGVGKTHLACALGHIAIRRRRTVHMAAAAKLFKRLKAARLDNTLDYEMRRLAGVELLILDDFALQPLDATETADFCQLCVERHQRASTVVTSNRTAEEWLSMMADPLLAQSAVDRLVSAAHELIIEGESYRRRQKPAISHPHNGESIDPQNGDHHDHS